MRGCVKLQYGSSGIEAQAAHINPHHSGRVGEVHVVFPSCDIADGCPLCGGDVGLALHAVSERHADSTHDASQGP